MVEPSGGSSGNPPTDNAAKAGKNGGPIRLLHSGQIGEIAHTEVFTRITAAYYTSTRPGRIDGSSKEAMHIFDLDHTLISGSSGRYYLATAADRGVLPRRVMLSIPMVYFRYRLGKLKASHINRDLPQLTGIRRKVLEDVAEATFEERIKPALYPDAVQYINTLKAAGEELALATSSVDIIVEPLMRYLRFESMIASSVEFIDGKCTGKFLQTPTFGHEKKARVLTFLSERRVDPNRCFFYSDSIYDLPLLQEVGHPVATNPDIMLNRHARKSGWRIMRFNK